VDRAFERFKNVADKKKQVFDEDLVAIVEDEIKTVHRIWQFVGLTSQSGTNMKPLVNVILKSKGKQYSKSSTGDGPVDACYKAIEAMTKLKTELLDYSIQSVTRGKDALGEVTVKARIKEKIVIAQGASTDIIEASAKAYINAINKALSN
jgi:2-isopropylmalate synthase